MDGSGSRPSPQESRNLAASTAELERRSRRLVLVIVALSAGLSGGAE